MAICDTVGPWTALMIIIEWNYKQISLIYAYQHSTVNSAVIPLNGVTGSTAHVLRIELL